MQKREPGKAGGATGTPAKRGRPFGSTTGGGGGGGGSPASATSDSSAPASLLGPTLQVPVSFAEQNNKRIVLALQSGLKCELTWALNILTMLSFKEKDDLRRDATPLAKIPGLLDAILQIVDDWRDIALPKDYTKSSRIRVLGQNCMVTGFGNEYERLNPNDSESHPGGNGLSNGESQTSKGLKRRYSELWFEEDGLFNLDDEGRAEKQQCAVAASNIIRNFSFMPENELIMAQHRHCLETLFQCIEDQHTVRCLSLLYERDCRHKFCPPSLWVAPARTGRLPIAAAARSHEAVSFNHRCGDTSSNHRMSSVISTIPHVFPFEERVQMFREFIKLDKDARRIAGESTELGSGSIEIVIRRDHIVEDGFQQLNVLGSKLKSCFNISFISECGLPEAGLDYGGLSKEFLTDVSKAAFDPKYGLFSQSSTSEGFLIPNSSARFLENGIEMIEFLGRIVGKALYEGILLDYSFTISFVQKLLGRYSFLDELSTLDPELYRNLMYVKHYEGDVKELALDFTITEEVCGKRIVTELRPGGINMAVTNENKLQYVYAIADYKLNQQVLPLANAFFRGLTDLVSPSWLSIFTANEFNQLLSGGDHDFDVEDLRINTKYTGGYSVGSRTIKIFWEVIKGFKSHERCLLLKFVTSCSRAPLLGFKHLQPAFTIHKVPCDKPIWAMIGGQDVGRLPSSSTCYNTLKLPTYKRASTLRCKLLYAINSNAGFELS